MHLWFGVPTGDDALNTIYGFSPDRVDTLQGSFVVPYHKPKDHTLTYVPSHAYVVTPHFGPTTHSPLQYPSK